MAKKKNKTFNQWVMYLIVLGILLVLGFALGMMFPGLEGASVNFLGMTFALSGVGVALFVLALVISMVMHMSSKPHAKMQSAGIMTIVTGAFLVVLAPLFGAVAFVGTFLVMLSTYMGAILAANGLSSAFVGSIAPAANTITFEQYPRIRKRK